MDTIKTVEEFNLQLEKYFTPEEIQIIKDTVRYGAWGDSDFDFPDGTTYLTWGYVTDDASKGGHFKGRVVSQMFNNISRKIKTNKIGFIKHIHDYWGDGSGSMIAFKVEDSYETLFKWSRDIK